MFHQFRNDPFYSFPNVNDHLDDFFADFHTGPLMNSLMYDSSMARRGCRGDVALYNNRLNNRQIASRDMFMFNPFESMNALMNDMNNAFGNASRQMERAVNDGNGVGFSSTRFVSYNNADGGEPQYYEATSATRHGPGGLRESRKTERNSATGCDKMAVGRHINDRGHVITKQRDSRTGQIDEYQDYLNIDEENAVDFDNEWQQKAGSSFGLRGPGEVGYYDAPGSPNGTYPGRNNVYAIGDGYRGSSYCSPAEDNERDDERTRSEKKKKMKKQKKHN